MTTKARTIGVPANERVCLNCIHYQLYYTLNKGNVKVYWQTCEGRCTRMNEHRTPLRRSCGHFMGLGH